MSSSKTENAGRSPSWSANDFLEQYEKLGIPHFQRGLVWGPNPVSLLLESLFYETPCGIIILWEPDNPVGWGKPLGNQDKPKYYIIDGQQRIRSICGVLTGLKETAALENGEESADEGDDNTVWCINLTRIPEPELKASFGDETRYPLFCRIRNPYDPKARLKKNFLPISSFLDNKEDEIAKHIKDHHGEGALAKLQEAKIKERVQRIRDKELFHVIILKEDLKEGSKKNTYSDMISLYNRINSGGMRVEAEEKAFATLVSFDPTNWTKRTNDWIRKLFEKIHGKCIDRNEYLKRQKERAFGFKLFIRTLIQVFTYHTGYSIGSNAFSFDLVNKPFFAKCFMVPDNQNKTESLFNLTDRILLYVWECLREELYCDDLRMLPETSSLWPVFQLLIRFPRLMDDGIKEQGRMIVAALVLRLYLRSYESQKDIMQLITEINKCQTLDECLQKMNQELAIETLREERVNEQIEKSRSLQSRYTLILYWLLRKRCASDFSYKNVSAMNRKRMFQLENAQEYREEVKLKEKYEPQKQHIIPYSNLKKVYPELFGKTRVGNHDANDIGNITYISSVLNSDQTGIGATLIDLHYDPPENLEAHILGGSAYHEIEESYQRIRSAIKDDKDQDSDAKKEKYTSFYKSRREKIAEAFINWLEELELPKEVKIDGDRIEAAKRLFNPTIEDMIREMVYPDVVEDALYELVNKVPLAHKNKKYKAGEFMQFSVQNRKRCKCFEMYLYRECIEIEGYKERLAPFRKLQEKVPPSLMKKPSLIELITGGGDEKETAEIIKKVPGCRD